MQRLDKLDISEAIKELKLPQVQVLDDRLNYGRDDASFEIQAMFGDGFTFGVTTPLEPTTVRVDTIAMDYVQRNPEVLDHAQVSLENTAAHELVHLSQFQKLSLPEIKEIKSIYRYNDNPLEKEAFARAPEIEKLIHYND